MYRYTEFDQRIVNERVRQFGAQVARWQRGELTEDEFRPLRLQNGLYVQRHAPMLRIAIPYGLLAARQLRRVAELARRYDRGYAHFTTRQNVQYNWPRIEDTPAILAALAEVQMHAIQTSGNCIRNITTDHFAGVAPDEIVDPRPYAELLRQWSTLHPEFAYLPRKFKFAVSGSAHDRAASAIHDVGLYLRTQDGAVVADVLVGGGLGRTPVIGSVIRRGLPWQHLLAYCEAILRVYNLHGRRDNKYKARIKILVRALGAEEFARQVDAEFAHLVDGPSTLPAHELARVAADFTPPAYRHLTPEALAAAEDQLAAQRAADRAFAKWLDRNVHDHKAAGYRAVSLSLKPTGVAPGDLSADQMEAVAELADAFSFGELRVSHQQNLLLADVAVTDLHALWLRAKAIGLATPNIGLLTDLISCPGGDFCALANAKSLPIAQGVQQRFDDLDFLHDIGEITLNLSGCINSCGHHHVGHIGILGVDKHGSECYQLTLGGDAGASADTTRIGTVLGPAMSAEEVPEAIARLIDTYVSLREDDERFIDTVVRVGAEPFKQAVYAQAEPTHA